MDVHKPLGWPKLTGPMRIYKFKFIFKTAKFNFGNEFIMENCPSIIRAEFQTIPETVRHKLNEKKAKH